MKTPGESVRGDSPRSRKHFLPYQPCQECRGEGFKLHFYPQQGRERLEVKETCPHCKGVGKVRGKPE